MLAKYWYIHGTGKKRERTQTEEKQLSGESAIKSKKVLEAVGTFSTALGSGGSSAEIKPESPEHIALMSVVEALRPLCFFNKDSDEKPLRGEA